MATRFAWSARRRGPAGSRRATPKREAHAIIAREHFFPSWDAFAAFAAARRDPRSPIARFEAAAEAIVDGDLETLTRLLREDPELVRARSARRHRATLFHYVGSNGIEGFRQRAPKNLVAIAAALLDAGADVNATAQMYGDSDTTLGLAATSIHPVLAGVLEPLLTFLLDRGATVGDDGVAAWSALINACHANARPAAAEFLAARAPALDLEAAAGLGRLDLVAACFTPDGRLKPPATEKQRNDGFMWACEYGRTEVVSLLLAKGMPVGAKGRTNGQTGLALGCVGRRTSTRCRRCWTPALPSIPGTTPSAAPRSAGPSTRGVGAGRVRATPATMRSSAA